MSKILDPWTRGYLSALGVGQGWRCLELGARNGSIAEWLCDTVGPSGSVTAIDINPVLLELIPAQIPTIRQMDVRTSSGELPANAYDLVSCRALLHQIAEYAPTVLAQMAAALSVGTVSEADAEAFATRMQDRETIRDLRARDRRWTSSCAAR